ncbi:long-subunit fatty acid transport protein [Desulfobotulus alkaliphilus]|uniref:Long-subunit fatty acid transport protein n=1 Tax=Desulfobotulus alkaliphilus TaxID=622671 RepID=A0A562S806_9BACT|nr:hypothetical protein [Desulfobotulus alkaliphilus]TWI77448.1 long-subunit fatty acid transport protein [Desulfobotulus alkaliphilus]
MKPIVKMAVLVTIVFVTAGNVFATLLDNNTNLSTEFIRMQARVGSADSTDAVVYNPAGTVWLDEGSYGAMHNQTLPKDYTHFYGGRKYETTTLTTHNPSFFYVRNAGNWSAFGGIAVHGGGGTLDYNNGTILGTALPAVFQNQAMPQPVKDQILSSLQELNLSSAKTSMTQMYPGLTIGGAYQIGEKLSLSLGGRVIRGMLAFKIDKGSILDLDAEATGFAPIIGVNYRPVESLNLSIRHEFKTKLDFEYNTLRGAALIPGELDMGHVFAEMMGGDDQNFRRDLSALTAFGFAWMVRPDFKLAADLTIAWNRDINQEGKEDNFSEGYEFAMGVEYFMNEKWTLSAGYSYSHPGDDMEQLFPLQPKLRYHGAAVGFRYAVNSKMGFQFGANRLFYDDQTDQKDITYQKDLLILSLGLDYRFR